MVTGPRKEGGGGCGNGTVHNQAGKERGEAVQRERGGASSGGAAHAQRREGFANGAGGLGRGKGTMQRGGKGRARQWGCAQV